MAAAEGPIAESGPNNMTRSSFSSLRFRLLFLVLLTIIPALALILYTAVEQRRAAALEAEANALRLAQLASNNQEHVIEVAHELLSAVAQLSEVRKRDSQGCANLFANLLAQYRGYANLIAAEPSGKVFCSGQPIPGAVNFADRDWFRRVVKTREFATSEYSIGKITGKPVVILGYPVVNASGQVEAVLSISLDLAWLNELAAKTRLPSATTLTVIDRKGTILVRFPDSEKWVGKSMAERPLFQIILNRGEGTAEAFGVDGITRLYGFSPLGTGSEAYVAVGIAKDIAFSTANFILERNLAALGVVAVLAVLAAWFGSDWFILRRVNALMAASKRLAAGDLSARAGPTRGQDEFSQLARTFDEMANSVERLISKRRLAEQRLTGLYEINVAITSTLDLHAVLTVLMEKIDLFLPYTAVLVWLRNSESGLLERAACWNLDEQDWKGRTLKGMPALVREAIEGKAPVAVANIQTDPRTIDPEFYRRHGLVSYLGIPLLDKGEVLGVLVVLTREAHEFTDEEVEFLTTLAGQAAVAIHNSQLYGQVRQRTHALSALYTIASAANETLDLDAVLQAVIKQITDIFHFDATRIFLLDSQTGELHLRDSFETRPGVFGIRKVVSLGVGINGRVAQSGEPMIFEDVQLDPSYQEISQTKAAQKGEFSFFAVFPIKARQKVLGTIICIGANPRCLSSDEIGLILSMTDRVGVAIENATLFERTKNQAHELEQVNKNLKRREEIQKLLKELSQDITSLDIDSLLTKLTKKAREVFDIDICDVRIREKETWHVMSVSGIERERLQESSMGSPRGRSGWIVENRRPLIISDIEQQKDGLAGSVLSSVGLRGYLGVPLCSRSGEVIGVLRALTYQPRNFTQEEVDLLQQMANGAAIALENTRLLDQTKKQAAELEQANKMQADFTAMIVHDLRSPLTNIIGTVEAMVEGLFGPVNEEQKEWLLKLLANGRSVADFINDYLDLSKVEAGRIDITKEEVDLGQLIQNSIENCLPSARNKNILIAGAVDPVLFRIKADPRRLNQVLSNLLSNAVKFTADGGQIEVGARQMNGTEIKVWVKDSGVGIASEEISSLFEKYRQLTSGKKSAHKGTGLGLVICKKIVEAHGGQIWVESKEGKGTTFFITLPF
jgi:signal transduction histidine kinase/HAMP domain-containing protein